MPKTRKAVATTVLGGFMAFNAAQAATYSCVVTQYSGHEPLVPKVITFELSDARVFVRDSIMEGEGLHAKDTKLDRIVLGDQIMTWKLNPVPKHMMPPDNGKFWTDSVKYRARLGLESGSLRISGRILKRIGNAPADTQVEARGVCDVKR